MWILEKRLGRVAVIGTIGVVALILIAGFTYYWWLDSQYAEAKDRAEIVQDRIADTGQLADLSSESLPQLQSELNELEDALEEFDRRLNLPIAGDVARSTPLLDDRVEAAQRLVDLTLILTSIAKDGVAVALEVKTTYQASGFVQPSDGSVPERTWLNAVRDNSDLITSMQERMDEAVIAREMVEEEHLSDQGQRALAELDDFIARAQRIRSEYGDVVTMLDRAFGSSEKAHYLVLLQNSDELRQAGGFPGTYALLTVDNGQLDSITISSIKDLDIAYAENRQTALPAPGPIREYLKQQEWLPHDATWSMDFSEAAATFNSMYAAAGWPELQGIVAVNYSAIRDVLEILGPYEVTVRDETQIVDSDNFIDIIEEYREGGRHKRVVAELGASMIDRVASTEFSTQKEIFYALRDAADRREIQAHMFGPELQGAVERRGWDGAFNPNPDIPTLAMTVSSLAGGKASGRIHARADVLLNGDDQGATSMTWTIELQHRGDPDGEPKYEGFHRSWLMLYLPDGATMTASSLVPDQADIVDDPRAVGFNIPMLPGEKVTLVVDVQFREPLTDMLLRRQSGFNNVKYQVSGALGSCQLEDSLWLNQDHIIALGACTVSNAR